VSVLRALRPGLWLTETHVEGFDVRGAVIVGEERAVVWDTLSHPRDMAAVPPLIGERSFSVVYSHADWDHAWGTRGLGGGWAEIIGHPECVARFSADVPDTLAEKRTAAPGVWDEVELMPPTRTIDPAASLPTLDPAAPATTLDLGGVTLLLLPLPGHTADCLVGWLPEWGVLLAGDAVEDPYPVVNDRAAVPAWISLLQLWEAEPQLTTVVPSHGAVSSRELLRRNIDFLERQSG